MQVEDISVQNGVRSIFRHKDHWTGKRMESVMEEISNTPPRWRFRASHDGPDAE